MRTAVHGMPRIGDRRALKWALEAHWAGRAPHGALEQTATAIRRDNWLLLASAGVDFIPSNDFSLYDHVLDAAIAVGAVPERFRSLGAPGEGPAEPTDLLRYFAMARGGDFGGTTVLPLDLTKWFDTNYHQLVPELGPETTFAPDASKARGELEEAKKLGVPTVPVLLGPLTFVHRSTAGAPGFEPLTLLDRLVDTYVELLAQLADAGVAWVRLDEPCLVEERSTEDLTAFTRAYRRLGAATARPKLAVCTYFGHVGDAMATLSDLPVEGIGLDLCAGRANLDLLSGNGGLPDKVLFAGVVDGRNVWANDLVASLEVLERARELSSEVVASTSCSLLHVPLSLATETGIDPEVRPWLAFAREKVAELSILARGAEEGRGVVTEALQANRDALASRRSSPLTVDPDVRSALADAPCDPRRSVSHVERARRQDARLALPTLPTTTIGSFPQTPELRAARAAWRSSHASNDEYHATVRAEIDRVIALQESLGIDVLVHGEPERDDMVRYFAAHLTGFVLPQEGWVQSYGSRCVRPPILFGDVRRSTPVSVEWFRYAQARTTKPVKGMLTGPVTMLRWSFVRDDQPDADTAAQLGLAVAAELRDLQDAGAAVIQVDEPALREGLPLRASERATYLKWATRAVRLVTASATPDTQVHTHMCYAHLGEIVDALDELNVDVISFEAARSQMSLLDALGGRRFTGALGPGVYDVHSPRIPSTAEIVGLLRQTLAVIGLDRTWVNPDCGLKTRRDDDVGPALAHMVDAARVLRAELAAARESSPHS